MILKWFGTASVELSCGKGRILFDPFVPLHGSPVDTVIGDFDGFPDIFVTHGHFDHIASIPEVIRRNPGSSVYCTGTPYRSLRKKGVPEKNLRLIEPGQVLEVSGFRISVLRGRHSDLPKVGPGFVFSYLRYPNRRNIPYLIRENRACPENGETLFYHIESGGKSISLIGSLSLRDDTEYPSGADALVLPYNCYGEIWPRAEEIIERLRPKRILLDHYDETFPPLTQPVDLSPVLEGYKGAAMALEHKKEIGI